MAYFMLIVDFSYALQAVMNIIMILLNNYFFEFALLHTSILLISFLFYKKNLLELATCKKVITCHEQSPISKLLKPVHRPIAYTVVGPNPL